MADVAVTDDVLTHAISELRKAFGDDSTEGYHLIDARQVETPNAASTPVGWKQTRPWALAGLVAFVPFIVSTA